MTRAQFNYPDLDVLDSPLMSPGATPFSALGGVPGSALAERIFNDPDSWDTDGDDDDYPEDVENDTLAWLTEEIEKFRAHSAGIETNGVFEQVSGDRKSTGLLPAPLLAVPQAKRDSNASLKGINRRSGVRPISLAALFENTNEDFSSDIQHQLSKILETGGIPHQIRPRSQSSALSPPSTSGSLVSAGSSVDSPGLQIQTASSVASSNSGNVPPSPIAVYSASATLSFLEWYGIYPDTPLLETSNRKSLMQRKKSMRQQKTPFLQPMRPSRPSSLLSVSTAGTAGTFKQPVAKRLSPAPPPGLDAPTDDQTEVQTEVVPPTAELRPATPPGLSRAPSPFQPGQQHSAPALETPARDSSRSRQSSPVNEPAEQTTTPSRSNSDSPRGRPLPTAAPPPYSTSPSPAPRRPSVASVGRSASNGSCSSSSPQTRERSGSAAVRRLPLIPPETSSTRPETPPRPQIPSRHTSPSPARRAPSRRGSPGPAAPSAAAVPLPASAIASAALMSGAPASFASFSLTSASMASATYSPSPLSAAQSPGCTSATLGGRPPSSIRSPLGGPAGPRTRSRASQDAGRAKALPIGHRPPVLRL